MLRFCKKLCKFYVEWIDWENFKAAGICLGYNREGNVLLTIKTTVL